MPTNYSRFFSIKSCGLKTGLIESLTNYLVRLSAAHSMTSFGLVMREYAPLFKAKVRDIRGHCDLFGKIGSSLNGVSGVALEGVLILEHLTTRENLRFLTLLPLKDVISARSSIRKYAAWCTECLGRCLSANSTIYMPLVWQLKAVTVCPIHPHRHLVDRCPHCKRQHNALGRRSFSGYCPRCGTWLGAIDRQTMETTENDRDLAKEAYELIRNIVRQECYPNLAFFRKNLLEVRDQLYYGSLLAMARNSHMHHSTLQALVAGESRPGLDTLLQLALSSGIRASALIGRSLRDEVLHARPIPTRIPVQRMRKCRKYSWDQIRKWLHEAVNNCIPSSLHSLCKRENLDPGYVALKFPKIARTLAYRFRTKRSVEKWIRERSEEIDVEVVVCHCLKNDIWPSDRNLKALLKSPGCLRRLGMRRFRDQMIEKSKLQLVTQRRT